MNRCVEKRGEPLQDKKVQEKSKVWRRFLDGFGMHQLEWSGDTCRGEGEDEC
jgi:hypothetical protein